MDGDDLDLPTETAITQAPPASGGTGGEGGSGASGSSSSSLVANPREALALAEARRIWTLSFVVLALETFVAATVLVLPAHPVARAVHLGGMVPVFLVCLWLAWALRPIERYRPWMAIVFAGAAGLAVASTFVYWGVFSSGCAVVPIAMYVFSSGQSLRPVYAMMAGSVLPHAVLGLLITLGAIPDLGIIQPTDLSALEAAIVLAIAQFIFAMALYLARMHRRTTQDAMEQLERATRSLAQREALLHEAKQELDRALEIGGPGRFSEQLVGPFRLGDVLGRGAMGEVYEAAHEETGEPAAVKLLTISAGRNPDMVRRFMREVEIASSLKVPNVVRVLDASSPDFAGLPYIAMERLRGETLSELLRERGRLSAREVGDLVQQIAAGLSAAHAGGIVHRDIKPQNIFQHREGKRRIWKILDFGISRLVDGETLTRDQLVGTPAYMSPEQARGEKVDHRTDIYSLAVLAYRALTGRPAFSGRDAVAILYAVMNQTPPPPSSLGRGDEELDRVLAKGMAREANERYPSADALAEAFEQLAKDPAPARRLASA